MAINELDVISYFMTLQIREYKYINISYLALVYQGH